MTTITHILVVEDSEVVLRVMRHVVHQYLDCNAVYATTLAAAKQACEQATEPFFAALVDLNLPDAPNGEIVDYVLQQHIPTIVLTGSYDEQRREQLFNKGVVDYVTKEGRFAYAKAVGTVNRLAKNQAIQVLVVDDSDMSRRHVVNLLKRHLFQVLEAKDGVEAIQVLLANPAIRMVVTDYNMPRMDGFELVKNLRYQYDKTDLIMIGISGESNEALSAKFIKHGANDFLRKPFYPEEFYCRITHNIEALEMIEQIAYTAQRDHLTGLFHRHHFFNVAREKHRLAVQQQSVLTMVVLDMDNTGEINQRYGSQQGDAVIRQFANWLEHCFGRFLVARADGDTFYVMLPGLDCEKAISLIATARHLIASNPIDCGDNTWQLTFSAGVTDHLLNSVDEQIARATGLLQLAKEAGGNMTVDDEPA